MSANPEQGRNAGALDTEVSAVQIESCDANDKHHSLPTIAHGNCCKSLSY